MIPDSLPDSLPPKFTSPSPLSQLKTSFLDIMLVWSRRGAAVSKADNKDLPIFGPLAKSFQFIFVDRGDKNSRSKTAAEISKRAADSNWVQTIIFPEGTTTNGTAVITFKNGPFSPGRPVQAGKIIFYNPTPETVPLPKPRTDSNPSSLLTRRSLRSIAQQWPSSTTATSSGAWISPSCWESLRWGVWACGSSACRGWRSR